MSQLHDRVVLVTGAASGMGRAAAQAFASERADVIVSDIDGDQAESVAAQIRAQGGRATSYRIDVSSVAELEAMFTWISTEYARLNVLFSHAGIQGPMGLEFDEEQFDHAVAVNLKSHFFATRYARALLRESAPDASIIYTSSAAGLRSCSPSPLYGATKAGIISMTRSMAAVLGRDGIRANAVCPGGIDTPFAQTFISRGGRDPAEQIARHTDAIPLGRIGRADDVAPVVLFLASDASRYVTGTWIPVDGGLTA